MLVQLRAEAFDPYQELADYQKNIAEGQYGATAVFVGSMRDFNEGDNVQQMWLEYYPGMTEKYLEKITAEASDKWHLLDAMIIHRVGEIHPSDPIVLVAVWSAHRAAAFDASRYLMEELKSRAPFWKKEQLDDASRWVEQNSPAK